MTIFKEPEMMEIGSKAPNIAVLDDQDREVYLKDYQGQYLVLYAYPRDNTPGCTTEACSFRDNLGVIRELGATVVGISADFVASHQKFRDKHQLNFPLLADTEHKLLEELGAWGEKMSFGKKRMGIIRSTFLFDKEGVLVKVWPKVSPADHPLEIAEFLKELQSK